MHKTTNSPVEYYQIYNQPILQEQLQKFTTEKRCQEKPISMIRSFLNNNIESIKQTRRTLRKSYPKLFKND